MVNQVISQLVGQSGGVSSWAAGLQLVAKWLPLVMLGLLTGCTASIHPLLTQKELIEQEDLSGRWELETVGQTVEPGQEKERLVLEIEKYDTSTYDVYLRSQQNAANTQDATKVAANRNKTQLPEAWTLQVGIIDGQRFAQVIPRDLPAGPPLVKGIPVYVFGRVECDENEIKFYGLMDTQCAALADREKLQHITYEPSAMVELTIFTMPTDKLQKVVIEHGDKIFNPKPAILRRIGTDRK